jgi:thioredoxin-dependent peroxiredoxin
VAVINKKHNKIMAQITLKGNAINTNGELPKNGTKAADFKLVKSDLSEGSLSDYKGKKVILNIFPSVDTGTCAMSVRKFNEKASALQNTVVLCISADLPFAQSRFCGAEGIANVVMMSTFRSDSFSKDHGVLIVDGPLKGLNARSIIVIGEDGDVKYSELVSETVNEPNYDSAIAAL